MITKQQTSQKESYQKNKGKIKLERDKPENKSKLKVYMDNWLEENKEHMKEYRNRPENKIRSNTYYQKHKGKAKIKRDKPENKAKLKVYQEAYNKRPEVIQRKKEQDTPEKRVRQKELSRKTHFKQKYNITIKDYNKMVEQQDNKCAVCGNEETNTFKGNVVNLSVDHNQKNGKVRELLCKDCNVSLGNLNEDISLFYKCIKYLKQYQEELNNVNLKEKGILITYSLTKEEYNKRAEQQNHRCAICNTKENGKKLSLDHNWKTGKVRGLLCKDCNVTLGNLKEDISLFYKCINYLNKHNSN